MPVHIEVKRMFRVDGKDHASLDEVPEDMRAAIVLMLLAGGCSGTGAVASGQGGSAHVGQRDRRQRELGRAAWTSRVRASRSASPP